MEDDYTTRRPTPDAIRDSVRAEDPSHWGTRQRDHDRSVAREGYQPNTSPLASGPVATDPTVAGYTGTTTAASDRLGGGRVIEERGRIAHAEPVVRADPPVERRRFSIGATFLGWAVAAFFTLVFSTIGLGLVGGEAFNNDGQISFSDANGIVIGSLVAYLVASFLAYLIGGYAAGRIALWDGIKHGLGTVGWAVLFALVAVVAGTYLADTLNVQNYLAGFDLSAITGETVLAIVLSLAAMLGGAALGGKLGERYHDRVHGIDRRAHRAGRMRGRPL